ncbi:PmoA family protein [Cellulomonas endophytica]|uniref:DUF6807 domain-containing protein n=1 Tax=Cellulomonas endophytica TaxID=2494735 RepID=UPI0013E90032|nr:PmoA family protein [Cellulomonas endophytica]
MVLTAPAAVLRVGGTAVAHLRGPGAMAPEHSPRPVLHPVTTLRGVAVTEVAPQDHAHHAGIGLALPDVGGTTYWGGRTYVRDVGPTMLANHGRQDVVALRADPDGGSLRLEVVWTAPDGTVQVREVRTLGARAALGGWVLDHASVLEAQVPLTLGSPATNGRAGAFYGGLLWRTPFAATGVAVADGAGEAAAHGSTSPWLLVEGPGVALLSLQPGGPDAVLPWFVRTGPHAYFCPAPAVARRRPLAAGEALALRTRTLVLDRPAGGAPLDAAGLAEALGTDA